MSKLTEWLNSNMHRSYPFAETNGVPTQLFVDAVLTVDGSATKDGGVFISELRTTVDSLYVYFGYNDGVTEVSYQTPVVIDRNAAFGDEVSVSISDNNSYLKGSLFVGRLQGLDNIPAVMELDSTAGGIFTGCVRDANKDGITGLQVGDTVYSGVVELVAGDGIDIAVTEGDDVTTITISAIEYVPPAGTETYTTDEELLAAAIEGYGRPVRTISGVAPDNMGNITVIGSPTENTLVAAVGDGVIQIKDMQDNAGCFTDDTISNLTAGIAALNGRASELADAITAVDNNNNMIATQLARIK